MRSFEIFFKARYRILYAASSDGNIARFLMIFRSVIFSDSIAFVVQLAFLISGANENIGGNLYPAMRDEIGIAFSDADFAELFPRRWQPAFTPWRLLLLPLCSFWRIYQIVRLPTRVRSMIDGGTLPVWS